MTRTTAEAAVPRPETTDEGSTVERDPRWTALAAPFPQDWIERLPKPVQSRDDNKGKCLAQAPQSGKGGPFYSADGHYCGGWHARSVHLSYIGHAGITMRLNDAVGPEGWSWEPMVTSPEGLPFMRGGEFWIKLTILGVTKYGVGDDFGSSSKQAIGDALRNAAMRFGIGTYLWSKSEAAHNLATLAEPPQEQPAQTTQQQRRQQGPTAAPEVKTDDVAIYAQSLAADALKATDLGTLKGVWDTATEAQVLNVTVPHPGGGECPLSEVIGGRKSYLENGADPDADHPNAA